MIVDTSAVLAVLRREPDALKYALALSSKQDVKLSAASYVECGIVADREGDPVLSRLLDHLIQDAGIEIVAFDAQQARIAREAYRDFGKGSGHKAKLNFGDCCAYALARAHGEPLLFKGKDFVHTDIASVLT